MTKEMYVCSTPHESKVAIVEDDQLAEIFYERENEYTLAGSIYKGRVTRVLPGMQSAFVDIGLERDAFLYVSDFLDLGEEEEEEFEDVPVRPEAYVTNRPQTEARNYEFQKEFRKPEPQLPQPAPEPLEEENGEETFETAETGGAEGNGQDEGDRGFRGGRRRRRGRRGRGFPETKFSRPERDSAHPEMPIVEDFHPPVGYEPVVLPGESISKYRRPEGHAESPTPAHRDEEYRTEEADASDNAPSFVIEGGFDEPEAQKQFAEPEGPAQPELAQETLNAPEPERRAVPKAVKLPFVLPGENIAKYRRGEPEKEPEVATAPVEAAPAPETTASVEQVITEKAESETPELATPPADAPVFSPPVAVLPGESIAKYRGRAEEAEAVAPPVEKPEQVAEAVRPGRVEERPRKSRQDEPRTEVRMERRSPVAPFVLPGESIAKYRRVAQPVVGEEEHTRQLQREIEAQPEEELAQEASELVEQNEPLSTTLQRESAGDIQEQIEPKEELEPCTSEDATAAEESEADQSADLTESVEPAVAPGLVQQYDEMNVASTFGGDAVESDFDATETGAKKAFNATESVAEPETAEHRHGYSAEAGHTLEHEELEEEDSDYALSEEEEEGDYVELEEQTYEPGSERNFGAAAQRFAEGEEVDEANGLTDALHDAVVDEETTVAEYPQDTVVDEPVEILTPEELDEGDEEFEESEMQASGAPTVGFTPEGRGVAFPQRGPRPFDRQRGRRGGRRMNNRPRREPRQVPLISDLLKEGQEVLIQIAKEPIGKKGARITSHIALPGRYLVYMPTVNHIGVSRKINSEEERQRLKRIMISEREGGHGGFIVRTAAEGITEDELRADIRFLKNLWADIRQRSDNSKAPALIYHDLNLVERVLRDQVTADFSAIWVDTEQEYERILRFANRFQPQLVRKVRLYTKSTPLYEQFGIQAEIDKALKSKVWLKSGGYIVINQTEALVAIDINTGKYVGKTARLEDTIVKTNVDAIKEIVRQIRLRDLGGIIVIDFIDMDERKNRQKVMQALEEALKSDRAPSKVLQFNDFGLVAITRKRVKQSLERTLGEPCPYCTGTGLVKSLTTMCNEIYVEMRKMAAHAERGDVLLRVNPEIAKALKASGGKWIQEMEDLMQKSIIVKSDPLLHQEHFDIEA